MAALAFTDSCGIEQVEGVEGVIPGGLHGVGCMGWAAWGGLHGVDCMGWTAWGGLHGAVEGSWFRGVKQVGGLG
jgi:hypothetical protein